MTKQLLATFQLFLLVASLCFTSIGLSAIAEVTEVTQYSTDDSYIYQGALTENHGSKETIEIRAKYGGSTSDWELYSLIKFDLSEIPANVYVSSADLYLYYYGYYDNDPVNRVLSIYPLSDQWYESTVTWNTRPRNAGKVTDTSTVPADFGWMTWDVSADIQNYIDGEWTNYGWQILDDNQWGDVNIPTAKFYSSEKQGRERPYIKIKYTYEPPNIPPSADPGGPYTVYVNESLNLDGSGSTDVDGNITGYRWDFDNDSIYDTSWRTSATKTHIYNETGNYTVVLQVRDDDNDTASNSTNVTVLIPPNKPPVANFTVYPDYPIISESIMFNDTSIDEDGCIVSWWWNFGDGHYSELQNPVHQYHEAGTYTVNLSIVDDEGANDSIEKEILIRIYRCGDINNDGTVTVSDIVELIEYLYIDGNTPNPYCRGDVNNDNFVNKKDIVYLINYIYNTNSNSLLPYCCD